jgi:hypothetical protein
MDVCEMLKLYKQEREFSLDGFLIGALSTIHSTKKYSFLIFKYTYTLGEKLAGEKVVLGLRPRPGLASGVCSSFFAALFCNKRVVEF